MTRLQDILRGQGSAVPPRSIFRHIDLGIKLVSQSKSSIGITYLACVFVVIGGFCSVHQIKETIKFTCESLSYAVRVYSCLHTTEGLLKSVKQANVLPRKLHLLS